MRGGPGIPVAASAALVAERSISRAVPAVSETCTACGLRTAQCPARSISPDDQKHTDPERCFLCMAPHRPVLPARQGLSGKVQGHGGPAPRPSPDGPAEKRAARVTGPVKKMPLGLREPPQ